MTFKSNVMGLGTPAGAAGAIIGGADVGKTATGTTQADAYLIAATNTQFTTVASGTGCIAPSYMQPGDNFSVFNNGANALLVYGIVGSAVNNGSVNAGFSVAANKSARFVMLSPTLFGVILSA